MGYIKSFMKNYVCQVETFQTPIKEQHIPDASVMLIFIRLYIFEPASETMQKIPKV